MDVTFNILFNLLLKLFRFKYFKIVRDATINFRKAIERRIFNILVLGRYFGAILTFCLIGRLVPGIVHILLVVFC